MVTATQVTALYSLLSLTVALAWVGGYLDETQKSMQTLLLGTQGDNRASYWFRSTSFPSPRPPQQRL